MRSDFILPTTRPPISMHTPARLSSCRQAERSRGYLYGIDYAPTDVRLSLVEASENKIGTPTDQFLLYCFHYDPATGKYALAILNIVRAGGVLTMLGMGLFFVVMRRQERKRVWKRGAEGAKCRVE